MRRSPPPTSLLGFAPDTEAPAVDRRAHATRVASLAVQSAIEKRLRQLGIPQQDAEDLRQTVAEVLLDVAEAPATDAECVKLALGVADNRAKRYFGKRATRSRFNVGPTADADEHVAEVQPADADEVERREKLTLAGKAMSKRAAHMMRLRADGFSDEEIAKRFRVSRQTVANTLSDARRKVRAKWAAHVAISAALLLTAIVLYVVIRARIEEARRNEIHADELPAVHEPTPHERAEALRREAIEDCGNGLWGSCERKLDAARTLDPAGDDAPTVKAARQTAYDGQHAVEPSKR